MSETEEVLLESIDDLGLTQAIVGPLKAAGIHSIGEVVSMPDEKLLEVENFGKAKLKRIRDAVNGLQLVEETAEPAPSFAEPKSINGPAHTQREENLMDAAKRSQAAALHAQQELRAREAQFRGLADALVKVGNSADQIRALWPEYQSPEEREE